MRRLLIALCALAACAPAAHAADAARLGGTTTIGAARAGYVPVQLEQPLRVVLAARDDVGRIGVKVEGGGPYAGFLLRLDDPSENAPGILSLRTPAFDFAHVSTVGETTEEPSEEAWVVVLPAGRYRLYAIATGAPVAVTVTIPGLPGVADLQPTFAVPAVGEGLARRDPLPLPNAAVLGQTHSLTSTGLVGYEIIASVTESGAQQIELCAYPPGSDASGSDAFGPGCPGGQAFSDSPTLLTAGYGLGSHFVAGPGEWGLGGNAQSLGAGAQVSGHGFWMSFDGTPIPGATIPDPPGTPAAPAQPAPPPQRPLEHGVPIEQGGAGRPAAKKPAKKRVRRRCPRVTRRSSRAQRRKAARCRAAQRRAARRRG